jgi:hypothetical protein
MEGRNCLGAASVCGAAGAGAVPATATTVTGEGGVTVTVGTVTLVSSDNEARAPAGREGAEPDVLEWAGGFNEDADRCVLAGEAVGLVKAALSSNACLPSGKRRAVSGDEHGELVPGDLGTGDSVPLLTELVLGAVMCRPLPVRD